MIDWASGLGLLVDRSHHRLRCRLVVGSSGRLQFGWEPVEYPVYVSGVGTVILFFNVYQSA